MKALMKVPLSVKIAGYFYIFISIFVFPIAVGFISELPGTEKIILGIFVPLYLIFNILMGFGMVKGNVRALKVFYYFSKGNPFYIVINRRIEEYIDEVEMEKISEELKSILIRP